MSRKPLDARTLRYVARKLGRSAKDDSATLRQCTGDDYDHGFYSGSASANEHAQQRFLLEARAIERKAKPATPGKRMR